MKVSTLISHLHNNYIHSAHCILKLRFLVLTFRIFSSLIPNHIVLSTLLRGPLNSPLSLSPMQYLFIGTSRMQCTKWAYFIVVDWLKKHSQKKKKFHFLPVSIQHVPTGWKLIYTPKDTPSKLVLFINTKELCLPFWTKIMTEICYGRRDSSSKASKALAQRKMLTEQLIYLS